MSPSPNSPRVPGAATGVGPSPTIPWGAWLIRRPPDDADHVYINARSDVDRGIWDVIGIFDIATGALVRELERREGR
jgi:hypothetical protein